MVMELASAFTAGGKGFMLLLLRPILSAATSDRPSTLAIVFLA